MVGQRGVPRKQNFPTTQHGFREVGGGWGHCRLRYYLRKSTLALRFRFRDVKFNFYLRKSTFALRFWFRD